MSADSSVLKNVLDPADIVKDGDFSPTAASPRINYDP
jgi:hypothetical protein